MRVAGDMSAEARDRLALKLSAYFHDVADRSIVTPGIDEKVFFLGGNRPGTIVGEAMRFVQEFRAG